MIAREIQKALAEEGIAYQVIRHPLAYTAQEEAAVSHVSGYEWAKTVVVVTGSGEHLMVVLPAPLRIDFDRLARVTGEADLRLADEGEFEDLFPNCERGAMPPLGNLYGERVFVDLHLIEDESIVFNAGDHREAIRMSYADFERLAKPEVGDISARPKIRITRADLEAV